MAAKKSAGRPPNKGAAAVKNRRAPAAPAAPGIICDIPEDLHFGRRSGSPFDALLDELRGAGAGKCIRFEAGNAIKASVIGRAKKFNMRVSFALRERFLYVRYDGPIIVRDAPKLDDAPAAAHSPTEVLEDLCLIALDRTPGAKATAGELVKALRSDGHPVGLEAIDRAITALMREKRVVMTWGRRGGENAEVYSRAQAAKAAAAEAS